MFHHIMVGCRAVERAAAFYDAVLLPLGLRRRQVVPDGGAPAACWVGTDPEASRFYVCEPFDRQPASAGNGSMAAFLAPSRAAVDAGYAGGLAAGGTDEGPPGPRPHYAADYYGAYLRDPDGNKLHLVWRGDLSAADRAGDAVTAPASDSGR